MKNKLQLLINSESNLTRSAFAKMLGIQPATVTHLLDGRNKPSYELLQKILLRFPNLNADWLMADRGEMLRDASLTPSGIPRSDGVFISDSAAGFGVGDSSPAAHVAESENAALLSSAGIQGSFFDDSYSAGRTSAPAGEVSAVEDSSNNVSENVVAPFSRSGLLVERVVVFYSDKTFDTYIPKK